MSWSGDRGVYRMTRGKFEKAAGYAGLELGTINKYGFFPPFIVNMKAGRLLEKGLEESKILNAFSAFQLIKLTKPE